MTIAGVIGTSDSVQWRDRHIERAGRRLRPFHQIRRHRRHYATTHPLPALRWQCLRQWHDLSAVVKNGVVPFPDGSQRLLHCMESPEHWFEDFGSAKLARGRAVVKLDANFAKVIKRGDYRVFVTPEGDCRGLYVRRKSANSFEVRELTGGKSSVAFSYRIVGRRKDIKGHRRFAKIDTPLPLPTRPARVTA